MAPQDAVEEAAAALIDPAAPGALAIVGHLPFLDRLTSLLVAGDRDVQVIAFRNGGLVRLVPRPGGGAPEPGAAARFAVAWVLTPELAGGAQS